MFFVKGIETLYQITFQILLLLFTQTKTPTTGGLESFFEKSSFMGLSVDPTTFLTISVVLSLKTCIFLHIKALCVEKGYFRSKAKFAVFLWALFATVRRVGTIIAFFAPSLGLFSMLHHWQAETTPFKVRIDSATKAENFHPDLDQISLYNMTEKVMWSSLDRWSYDDPNNPSPPSYSMYTGLTLQNTFITFIGLSLFQNLILLVVKIWSSEEFGRKENYFHKLTHILQISSIPFPYQDWDADKSNSAKIFKEKYKKTEYEMAFCFLVNFIFTLVMLAPLSVTGYNIISKKRYIQYI